MSKARTTTASILKSHEKELVADWQKELASAGSASDVRIGERALHAQMSEFIGLLRDAAQHGDLVDVDRTAWQPMRQFLQEVSRSRVAQGFTSEQTALFIFSFKKPLFVRLRKELGDDPETLAAETWAATQLLDRMALLAMRSYQQSREEVIVRQQEEMLELSTPVVKLWDGVLGLPMIGTLDSARTQVVMETLLQRIVETGAEIAIIDITGVPTVDTQVAQHLLKTVAAIRLMGADCIISGVRPQIAQTIVHLGVDLHDVTTKATLADALALALQRSGWTVERSSGQTR
ncbi:MAG TPA: STAS domain-containing protein [Phycisphaerae bacterium]|nr:STAS domain-containing protein [Phycisphaerales bacterium]HRX84247.1 STAS domain-containing protein [Phycisphaerae bacterium]